MVAVFDSRDRVFTDALVDFNAVLMDSTIDESVQDANDYWLLCCVAGVRRASNARSTRIAAQTMTWKVNEFDGGYRPRACGTVSLRSGSTTGGPTPISLVIRARHTSSTSTGSPSSSKCRTYRRTRRATPRHRQLNKATHRQLVSQIRQRVSASESAWCRPREEERGKMRETEEKQERTAALGPIRLTQIARRSPPQLTARHESGRHYVTRTWASD